MTSLALVARYSLSQSHMCATDVPSLRHQPNQPATLY